MHAQLFFASTNLQSDGMPTDFVRHDGAAEENHDSADLLQEPSHAPAQSQALIEFKGNLSSMLNAGDLLGAA